MPSAAPRAVSAPKTAVLASLLFALPLLAEVQLTSGRPDQPPPPPPDGAAPPPRPALVPTPDQALVARFDHDGDHRLNATERAAARAFVTAQPSTPPAPPPRPGADPQSGPVLEPVKPGPALTPADVESLPSEPWFGTKKVRTLFLSFADPDWEQELADFAHSDVLVPARLEVDGQTLAEIGVRFPGPPKLAAWRPGYKRDLRLVLNEGQQLGGRRRLDLQAASSDPTYLRGRLYRAVSREFLPTPDSSFVRVVINGEDWGLYECLEPMDVAFLHRAYGPKARALWTAAPGANLAYLGDDPASYRPWYHLETAEDPAAWAQLIKLCKVLHEAKGDDLARQLPGVLDLDTACNFFALENAMVNEDGYGSPTGSYGLYLGHDGRIRLLPRDAELSFRLPESAEPDADRPHGPGRNRGGAGGEERSRRGPGGGESAGGSRGGGEGGGRGGGGGGGGGPREGGPAAPAAPKAMTPEQEAALIRPYLKENQTKTARTDLALLLSHSFIGKADADHDDRVTAEEWHAFANSWFVVMDEDIVGWVSREDFLAKVRLIVTPPSVIDGRTKQTFGRDDPATLIAEAFLQAVDANHDGRIVREELVGAFDGWFKRWVPAKGRGLTQPDVQAGFTQLFGQSVFTADQAFIDQRKTKAAASAEETPRGGPEGGGGPGGGSGLSLGPIRLGMPKLGRGDSAGGGGNPQPEIHREQVDPMWRKEDPARPLLGALFSQPQWRSRYRAALNQLAENWLLWARLGPLIQEQHAFIADAVRGETHRPHSYARFVKDLDVSGTLESTTDDAEPSLKAFVKSRRAYLLKTGNDE